MLCWICEHTKSDRVGNDGIHDKLEVAPLEAPVDWYGLDISNETYKCVNTSKDLFESIQFLRNYFIETRVVPNVQVYAPVYINWILNSLKTKKLVSDS